MKNIKKSILKTLAKVGLKSAVFGANSVSMLGYCQAKEPSEIKSK